MRRVLRDNGLSLTMFGLFAVFLVGQSVAGWKEYNADRDAHGQRNLEYSSYLTTGHFAEAVFENWESEFLQMGSYVLLTAFLFQRGSAESKDPDASASDEDAQATAKRDAPRPLHRGALAVQFYSHSLSLALGLLFVLSFIGHAWGGLGEYNQEQLQHGRSSVSLTDYLASSRFWFESFQNWQSEFLAVGVLVVLSIWLRERGSPESKPLTAPHGQTGK